MPRIRLTKSAIDALPVLHKDNIYWDSSLPGFGVKVTPKGCKVFVALYRTGGRLRKYTIGPYGRITLAMARGHAQKIFVARLDGRDPAAEKREAKRRLIADRVDDLVEAFIDDRIARLRTAKKLATHLRRDVLGRWGGKSIHEIKRRDVIDLVTEVSGRGTSVGRKTLKILKTFFAWCVGRAIIDFSPAQGIPNPGQEKHRDRVLDDSELADVILAARAMPMPFGAILDVLALTGQRREEVTQMAWAEINEQTRTWCIPAARAKNGKTHLVHLSDPVWAIIQRMPRTHAIVFPTSGERHFQAFKLAKRELDRRSGVSGWWLHDLRRTMVSGMARLGIPPHVADKILNHQSGTISGVAAIYQRHDFLAERKEALERWGQHVTGIIAERSALRAKPDCILERAHQNTKLSSENGRKNTGSWKRQAAMRAPGALQPQPDDGANFSGVSTR
jgi:integrase